MSTEKKLQNKYETSERADRFEKKQKIDFINPSMELFISNQEMMFIATADSEGKCNNSFRSGPKGFLRVIDSKTLYYPEYHGNGVYSSLSNIVENPNIGIILIDFTGSTLGLHINGTARIVESTDKVIDPRAERYVEIKVVEVYLHCSKNIPQMEKVEKKHHCKTGDSDYVGCDPFKISGHGDVCNSNCSLDS